MPSVSSGRIVKTTKRKGGTETQKQHRWESFTAKISKLNTLDPIRRVRRHDLDGEDIATTTSYFKAGLEKWLELNITEAFAVFARDVGPLCDSLPQILHFEDQIMELLAIHIEKRDKDTLEALLELLTDFAHDLGARFEKFYARSLGLVIAIAGSKPGIEAIEWSFGCLAWLFKYLSKLLVSDLRPTYDMLAPLMGKERHSPHIARFTAEALSFLVRKAAAPSQKGKGLPLIVSHVRESLLDMSSDPQFSLYFHGVMTMFAEAAKGNGVNIHSTGTSTFQSLLAAVKPTDLEEDDYSAWMNVISGVLVSLVHHSTAETFKDVMECLFTELKAATIAFETLQTKADLRRMQFAVRILGIVAGVRSGSRINDWPPVLSALSQTLKIICAKSSYFVEQDYDEYLWRYVALSACIMLSYAPMDAAIPFVSAIMDSLIKEPFASSFLISSSYLGQMNVTRFRTFMLPYFQRYVIAHWSDSANINALCLLLPDMVASAALPSSSHGKDAFAIPQSWQAEIVGRFEDLETSPFPEQDTYAYDEQDSGTTDSYLHEYSALLDVLQCTGTHPSTTARIAEILLRKLKLALRPSSALVPDETHFIVGKGFSAYTQMSLPSANLDASLRPILHAAAVRFGRLPKFLEALLAFETGLTQKGQDPPPDSDVDEEVSLLINSLVENLSSESENLRLLSLRLLQKFVDPKPAAKDALSVMVMIDETPITLQTARSTSMHIRRLATLHKNIPADSAMSRAVVAFLFGMLNVKYSQIWEDASLALQEIAGSKHGEEAVTELAFSWLETPSHVDAVVTKVLETQAAGLTDFECTNLAKCDSLAKEVESSFLDTDHDMRRRFEAAHQLIARKPAAARRQALRILATTPQIAEKHSRRLVPMFLSWSDMDVGDDKPENMFEDASGADDDNPHTGPSDWTRKDQKAQLELFTKFVNPRVLYKSDDVHGALLNLVGNGDIDIQRSALKAIFTWKLSGVKPYEENLLALLDEARFKEEVTLLLQGQTHIQAEHRQELMPILLRVLYGRSVARGRPGMEGRRLLVIRSLRPDDTAEFLRIAMGKLQNFSIFSSGALDYRNIGKQLISPRKQNGLVHMLEDLLKETGTKIIQHIPAMLDALLYCILYAGFKLQDISPAWAMRLMSRPKLEGTEARAQASDMEDSKSNNDSLHKIVRQTGIKCLILLFSNAPQFEWTPYIKVIVEEVVCPRIDRLSVETAQSTSGTLQLLSAWASSPYTALFLGEDCRIIPSVMGALNVPKAKDSVKQFVLDFIGKLVSLARDESPGLAQISSDIREKILNKNMDTILHQIGRLLASNGDLSKDMLEACVSAVSNLAPVVTGTSEARNLIGVSLVLLDQPSRRVSPKAKSGLLEVLEHFVPLYSLHTDSVLKDHIFKTVTSLFGFFKDRNSREVLCRVLAVYSTKDPVFAEVAAFCTDINAFSTRLDEPDYDRRLRGFVAINKPRDVPFTADQWRPLLYNSLYYIKHDEEFGILSSNSSDTIRNFLTAAAEQVAERQKFEEMITTILVPAIFAGVREHSEFVRREIVRVMAHLVKTFSVLTEMEDLKVLLCGDDEVESSFFNNILAAGKGRQSGAMTQLCRVDSQELSSRNVSQFFIPLLEHFVFDRAEGSEAHNLAVEATTSIATLAQSLEWSQYRAILRRYIGYISSKPELEKHIIRLVGKVIEALAQWTELAKEREDDEEAEQQTGSRLATSLPSQSKLSQDIIVQILPALTSYLHEKDDSTVSLRVPVAVIIVQLIKLLPDDKMAERLPGVLTDLCHILRSKAPESRDMTRETLIKICTLLGASHFGFVLKELRGALSRGYQLHVLSYTMHAILVATTPIFNPGDLDYCLPSIVNIIMDDIFGVTGQEKDAEEYVSRMKEVKSSKSHDSMELIASRTTLGRLTELIRPIQILLKEKLDIKMARKIDELLNRISTGLLKNPASESRNSLIFCYEVIQEVYKQDKSEKSTAKEDFRTKRYLLQKGANKSGSRGSTTVYTHKLVRFAFDVLRSVMKRYDNLRTSANLTGFVPIIGDALLHAEEEVKISTLRLLTTIVRVPFNNTEDSTNLFKVAVDEAIRSISSSSTITTDISQASFKLLSVVLRDRREVPIKEKSVDELLKAMKDDITNPDTRHITFSFLRSVLDAKLETAGVYDTLDYVGTVMVTNEDKTTRDLARGAYFQFVREYPQTRRRWSKQLAFVMSNLKYDREGGRLSILEVIRLLLSKSSDEFVQEVAATCFVPLIFVLANDDSETCRKTAGDVMKEMFAKADKERTKTFLDLLRSWIEQTEKPSVVRLAIQAFGFYYDTDATQNDADIPMLRARVSAILESAQESGSDWELLYASLQLANVLAHRYPTMILTGHSFWETFRYSLSYPHAWVKLSAAKLNYAFLKTLSTAGSDNTLRLPLNGARDLSLDGDDAIELIQRNLRIFRTPALSEELAAEAVQNLLFLGRCAGNSHLKWSEPEVVDESEGESDDEDDEDDEKLLALEVMLRRISAILRRETRPALAPALVPKTAALQLLRQLCGSFSEDLLEKHLSTILRPLQNMTDPDIPVPFSTDDLFKTNYEALRNSAQGLMTTLQNKCGVKAYTAALLRVREDVKARRNQRTQKRKVEAITAPEKHSRDKLRKVERKKERRKEKGMAHRDRRRGY